jgi:transposase, IS5 family
MGDPLVKLKAEIDFEDFRGDLNRVHDKSRKSNAGVKPFDVVLMFKMLILQHLYNLSGDGLEYPIRDRLSFMRFLGLQREDRVPDAQTVWLFRERLKALGRVEILFARFNGQLARRGDVAKSGQMIDATFVEAPRQRNSREENAKIKAGEIPDGWEAPGRATQFRCRDSVDNIPRLWRYLVCQEALEGLSADLKEKLRC